MRILGSSVSLAASVTTATTEVRRERSLFWSGDPPPAARRHRAAPDARDPRDARGPAQVQEPGIYLREDGTAGTVQHVDLET